MNRLKIAFPAPPARCPDCRDVLTWTPDVWLAAHERVFECRRCGRLLGPQSGTSAPPRGPARGRSIRQRDRPTSPAR